MQMPSQSAIVLKSLRELRYAAIIAVRMVRLNVSECEKGRNRIPMYDITQDRPEQPPTIKDTMDPEKQH
jgi:hypothetical protein